MKPLCAALLCAVLFLTGCSSRPTIQQQATHMIHFLDKDEQGDGICTATAVGPHVILTAQHCVDPKVDVYIMVDLSTHKYKIFDATIDDRDHILVALDGPAFTNYIDLANDMRPAVAGERVYMYGDGKGQYPPRKLTGYVYPNSDPSDVDGDQGIVQFRLPVISGDSGAAVYGRDGKIVSLVTYGDDRDMIGFGLDFSAGQLAPIKYMDPNVLELLQGLQ